jgi:MFS family permease
LRGRRKGLVLAKGTAGKGAIRAALRHRDFRFLVGAQAVSEIGDWLYSVALIVYVLDRTHSAAWVGLTTIIRLLPFVLFSTFGGVIADHYDRKKLMIVADVSRGVLMGALALIASADGSAIVVLVVAALATTFSTVYLPCVNASTPVLVGEDDLAAANTITSTVFNLALALGPAIGGLLLVFSSPPVAFAVNGITYLASAALTLPIRTSLSPTAAEGEDDTHTSFRERLAVGFRAILSSSTAMLIVVLASGFSLFYGMEVVLYSLASTKLLGLGEDGLGFMFAAVGVGGVLGAGLAGRVNRSTRQGGLLAIAAIVCALPMMSIAFVHRPGLVYVLLTVEGVAYLVGDVLYMTMLQRILAASVLGRVMGILDSVMVAAILGGSVLAPAVVRIAGLETALVIGGAILVVLGLAVLPKARELDRASAAAAAELAPRVEVLKGLGIFEAASPQTLEALAKVSTEIDVAAGTVVIREGDEPDDLYAIVSGTLEVTSRGEGREDRRIREMEAGDYFGEIGLIERIPRTASVTASSDCRLLRISGQDFLRIVAERPRIGGGNLRAGIAARLARTNPSEDLGHS